MEALKSKYINKPHEHASVSHTFINMRDNGKKITIISCLESVGAYLSFSNNSRANL